jgi:Protein of unknown function (DUF2970)
MRDSVDSNAAGSIASHLSKKASLLRTVQAVGWSFLGIRKKSAYEEDVVQLNPVHLILVGLLGALFFIGTLVMIVRWVVAA